jgi:hypothetical protein
MSLTVLFPLPGSFLQQNPASERKMRRPARFLVVLALLLVQAGVSPAQIIPPTLLPVVPTTGSPGELPPPDPESALLPAAPWRVDLLVGLPTALRLQRTLGTANESPFVGELVVGFEWLFPTFGAGIRYHFTPDQERRDCLRISPGIDAYVLDWPGYDGGSSYMASADIDFLWEHYWGKYFGTEMGIKLGIAGAFGNRAARAFGTHGNSVLLPVVSVFGGFSF